MKVSDFYKEQRERGARSFDWQGTVSDEELMFAMTQCKWGMFRERMLEPVVPLIEHFPEAKWLTVGDGYGKEAAFLARRGADVMATDVDSRKLPQMQRIGMIQKWESQDLEKLTYADASYDFVLVKEALHHLARPYMGLYEMLRVARKALVIIEPQDPVVNDNLTMQVDGMNQEREARIFNNLNFFFEPIGNYVHRFSKRDFEKFAYGMGRTKLATRGINDVSGSAGDINNDKQVFEQVVRDLVGKDLYSQQGMKRFEYLMAIVFVDNTFPPGFQEALLGHGWDIHELLQNPYVRPS